MLDKVLKILGILVAIATIMSCCIGAVALIPAFGQWLSPQVSTQYVVPSDNGSPNIVETLPTAHISDDPDTTNEEPVVRPTTAQKLAPTNIPASRMYNFTACKESCNGGNSASTFPSKITKIYIEWDYENIPYGARYVRTWKMNGREWIKYNCTWTGSENGRDSVKLTEPKGLHSGTWELTISVDSDVLLSEQINISGNWDYWDPAGTLNSCYGTTD